MKITLFLPVLLALFAGLAHGAQLRVSPSGGLTLNEANRMVKPGDTVCAEGGVYSGQQIAPAVSGKDGAYISYVPCDNKRPVITSPPNNVGIVLRDKDYIRVRGFEIRNVHSFLESTGSDWNIFEDNYWHDARGWAGAGFNNSHYNKIINNRIDRVGFWVANKPTGPDEGTGDMLTFHCSTHNLIEGNHLSRGGHSLIANNGNYNVIRNNVFDQKWGEDKGYRAMELTANMRFCSKTEGYSLVEHNVFKNMLKAPSKAETTGFKVEGKGHIVRFNLIDTVHGPATTCVIRPPRIPWCQDTRIYFNEVQDAKTLWEYRKYGKGEALNNVKAFNRLVNTGLPTQTSKVNPAYDNGPAYDKNVSLTVTVTAGSGTSVKVQDAAWFSDGNGIIKGDLVKVGTNAPVMVDDVNLKDNVLVLTKAIEWAANAPVRLAYKEEEEEIPPPPPPVEPKPEPEPEGRTATVCMPVTPNEKELITKEATARGIKTGHYARELFDRSWLSPTSDQ